MDFSATPITPRGAGDRRKRRFLGALALLLVAGSVAAFLYVRSTPTYAVWRIRTALAERDRATFEQYVDIDLVVESAVAAWPQSIDAVKEPPKNTLVGKVQRIFKAGIARAKLPLVEREWKGELQKFWANRTTEPAAAEGEFVALHAHLPDAARSLQVERVEDQPGSTLVHASVLLTPFDERLPLKLQFIRTGGHLRLIRIVDSNEAIGRLEQIELAWKRRRNAEAQQKLDTIVSLISVGVMKGSAAAETDRQLKLIIRLLGKSERAFHRVQGEVLFRNVAARQEQRIPFDLPIVATAKGMQSTFEIVVSDTEGTTVPAAFWQQKLYEERPRLRIHGVQLTTGERMALPFPDVE